MSGEPEVLFARDGRAGLITLNRPKALNAVTLGMVRGMHRQLADWASDGEIERVIIDAAGEKAFSAGGDIRALYDWGRARDPRFLTFYREEYRLNTFIKRFPKPYVALIDGIVMGGGVGVSFHGSHRLATQGMTFAMPETGIGLFPDVGGTWFLPRCPGAVGMYLGLTGARLKAADAVYCGLATHHVPREQLATLNAGLRDAEDTDGLIADMARDPGEAPLAEHREMIDRVFSAGSVEEILERLQQEGGGWADKTAATIRTKSPMSLKITFRQIREGSRLSFEECMKLEYRMVNGVFAGHDFFEGTRATVIDKDGAPRWRPASIEEVTGDDVAAYFRPLGAEELTLE